MTMSKLIILDRDGVINEDSDNYIKSVKEWIPIPGSIEAIARLSKAGYIIAIATNQSGLARGYFSENELMAMHDKLTKLVEAAGGEIATIQYCPHHPDQNCTCRKPKPGMITTILNDMDRPASDAWMIGDSLKDLQAGKAAGCSTALVKTGKGLKTLTRGEGLQNTYVFENLSEFCDQLLSAGY